MRAVTRLLLAVFLAGSTVALLAATAQQNSMPSANVKTMAGILATLNHFASDAEKKTLQGIVASESATAHEKTLATALLNLQHTVTPADKTKLDALMKDESAPAPVRTIAGILSRLNHAASATEKAELTKLAAAA